MSLLIKVFLLLFSNQAQAASLIDDFDSRDRLGSATLVVNQAQGTLHPTLRVMNFRAGFTPLDFTVGDGSHGSFDPSTYQNFSVGGDLSGNIIRLDTDQFPELNTTLFHLEAGWILEPVGSGPLIIKSQTDVTIAGEIRCNGDDGANAIGNSPGRGGTGRCGGGQGGDGGGPMSAGVDGGDIDGTVTGGRGGNFTGGAAVGGGGGGSWNTSSAPGLGPNSAGLGGQAGTSQSDPEFLTEGGGAGGGGGSGTNTEAGAGGGGGGGVVIIHAVRNFVLGQAPGSVFGLINVDGGDGGSSNVAGGPGGGGAGGSVQVFVGSGIEIYNTDAGGAGRANFGTGGSNNLAVVGANGGSGRNWYSSVTYNLAGTGFYTPAEQGPLVPGNVEFNSATQEFISTAVDLGNTRPSFTGLSIEPSSSDFVLQVAGSDDGFVDDDTGFISDVNLLTNKRYIKFKVSLTTSNVNSPTAVDQISINYTPGQRDDFQFSASSCGRLGGTPSGQGPTTTLLLILPFLVVLWRRHGKVSP